MTEVDDFWGDDGFEDTVAAALIACFETKVRKNRGAAPPDRLTDARVSMIRNEGPYIASNSRVFEIDTTWKAGVFDLANDQLPARGLFAFRPGPQILAESPTAYLKMVYFRRSETLGKAWKKRRDGDLYELINMDAEANGIHGDRSFFTVDKNGEVHACTQELSSIRFNSPFGKRVDVVSPDESWLSSISTLAGFSLQAIADRKFCWTITASEKSAKAHIGCMGEEIKSLLYARSLPMTATGRRRPILHLVEAHKRRIKAGTDIDVTAFLRGQQVVEFGGTTFTVMPPHSIGMSLSKNSRKNYLHP